MGFGSRGVPPPDSTPDSVTFLPQTNVARDQVLESNIVTPTGYTVAASVSVQNGEYRINGGAYMTAPGMIAPGDTLQLRHTSGAQAGQLVTTTVSLGGLPYTFESLTTFAPGQITFETDSTTLAEEGGAVSVNVKRLLGSDGAVGISFTTANGTAVAPTHYVTNSGTLSWADGDATDKQITLTPIDDQIAQPANLQFSVILTSPTGGASLGALPVLTVTINDDDNVPVPTQTEWVGIPSPTPLLGYEFFEDIVADPAGWATGPVSGFWYVDKYSPSATDTGNPNGWPGQPRASIPSGVTIGPGEKVVIVGDDPTADLSNPYGTNPYTIGSSQWGFTANGNTTARAAVEGRYTTTRPFVNASAFIHSGTYTIVEGLGSTGLVEGPFRIGTNSVIRDCFGVGLGVSVGSNSGSQYNGAFRSVNWNCWARDYGIPNTTDQGDQHGCKPAGTVTDFWLLNFTGFNLQGDTCQVGDANSGNPTRIYIGGMRGWNNKENGLDVKLATDVICSEAQIFQMAGSPGQDIGAGIVLHDGYTRCWILNSIIHDCVVGIITTEGQDCYYLGNLIYNMQGTPGENSGFGGAVAMHARTMSGEFVAAFNTCHSYGYGMQITSGSASFLVAGNIFSNRFGTNTFDVRVANSGLGTQTTLLNNLYTNKLVSLNGGSESGSISGDPQFVSLTPLAEDFQLQATSPAIDAYTQALAAFDTFQTRYQLDIKQDILGQARVVGQMDIGAYERAPS